MRVRQPRQDRALAAEALLAGAADEAQVQQLDGGAALEAAVAAPGQPHRPHPALSDLRLERVGPERLAGQRRRRQVRTELEKCFAVEFGTMGEQRLQLGRQDRLLAAQLLEPDGALGLGHFERPVEKGLDDLPAIPAQSRHASSRSGSVQSGGFERSAWYR